MSSTKAKMALVVALVLLFVTSAGLIATWQFLRTRQDATNVESNLEGFWEGSVSVNERAFRLVLKVNKTSDGGYTATLDSIDHGSADIPVNGLSLSNRTVRLQLAALRATYEGELNQRGTEISGEWRQGRITVPVIFKRTETPPTMAAALPASAYAPRADSPFQGLWKGTVNAGGIPVHIVVRISESAPGKFTGSLDSPGQGARNIPLTTAEYSKPMARFEITSINVQYEGILKDDGSEIEGDWIQAGRNFRCVLKRADLSEDIPPDASAYAFASDSDLQGHWNGTLESGAARLRLRLKIARSTNGTYTACVDSLDQGSKDIQASRVVFNAPNVEVEWPALRALFHGQLENGKLAGFWQQGPSDIPIEFVRTNRTASAVVEPGRN